MFMQMTLVVFLVSGQTDLGFQPLGSQDGPSEALEAPAAQLQPPAWSSSPTLDGNYDAGVLPAVGSDSSLAPVQNVAIDSAVSLLRHSLERGCPRPLTGQATSLASALTDSVQRSTTAQAYWRLAKAIAAYQFCVEETDFLLALPVPQAGRQQTVLTAQQASAKADEARARLDALRAQQALAATLPSLGGGLPLTSELPFVGAYETHYKTLQLRGLVSEQLTRIHHTIPAMRELIERQADAVLAGGAALSELRQDYEAGRAALADVLESFRHVRQQRREFLASVLDYNESIAEYAFSVASPNLPVTQVVGMLIEHAGGQREERSVLAARRDQSSIRRVSNEEPVPAAADGWSGR